MAQPEAYGLPSQHPNDFFIETVNGINYEVPSHIVVYDPEGRRMDGSFELDPETGICIAATAKIDRTAMLEERVIVGAHSRVRANSLLRKEVWLGEHVLVADRVRIYAGTEIWDHASIGRKSEIQEGSTLGKRVTVGSRVRIGADAEISDGSSVGDRNTIAEETYLGPGSRIPATDTFFTD